jgi:hypothetical protein
MMGKAVMLVGSARRSGCLVSTSGIAAKRRNKSATELSDCQNQVHIRPDSKCLPAGADFRGRLKDALSLVLAAPNLPFGGHK